jgi:RNA-directed DNA polymerase
MKISPEQVNTIQSAFKVMNSKTDFLALLNEAKNIIYGDKTVPFEEKQLNYYINKDVIVKKDSTEDKTVNLVEKLHLLLNKGNNRYKNRPKKSSYVSFQIKKKEKGQFRTIYAPVKGLKEFQKALTMCAPTSRCCNRICYW